MAVATFQKAGRFIFIEPFKAAFEHGNQALVTSASAYMAAMFSMQHGVLPWLIAVPLAIGFEWTYLRGLSTSDKTRDGAWSSALNWVAMLTSAVYGILYILGYYKVIPEAPDNGLAFWLAVAHVAPMTLLSFCYAGVRRTHKQEQMTEETRRKQQEATRLARLQDQQDQIELERQKKLMEIEVWKQGKQATVEMQTMQGASSAYAQNAASTHSDAPNAQMRLHTCASCGASLNAKQYAASKRWGHCPSCKKA